MTDVIKIPAANPRAKRGQALRMFRNPLGILSIALLVLIVLIAVFAEVVAPGDPSFADVGNTLADPGAGHLLGTDSAGRDVLSRLIHGARLTLLSALLCAAVAIAIGLPSGLIAGYYGGRFDSAANWVANMIISLPSIIVLLSIRATLGPSVWTSMIVFGIMLSPSYYRLTRTAVQAVRNELYVDAARVAGLSDVRVIARHIISVVRAPLIIQTALISGVAIAIQSGLQFLGLGDPSEITWGEMLGDGFSNIYVQPILMLWPALAIGITIGSLVLLGNAIRDALEDKRENRPSENALEDIRAFLQTEPVQGAADDVESEEALLSVEDLSIGYPDEDGSYAPVVRGVSWSVRKGEVLGIVGESGSGKSQTAFGVLGLLPSNARILGGTVTFDGQRLVAEGQTQDKNIASVRGRRIGYIPQEPMSNLDPAFTIGHQLSRPAVKLLGISKAAASRRARELLSRVGIPDPERTMRAYPHEISGGMAQRVLIAGALMCDPDLILADEPTTALDVTVQAEVLDVIRRMQQDTNVAVVIVTHNMGVVADIADRVVVMRDGRAVESGDVSEILLHPSHEYTKSLLASMLVGREPRMPLAGSDVPGEIAVTEADSQASLSAAAEAKLREEI